ncbi:MAG: hypothetical protein ACYCZM_15080 [Acidimicrobiales bacterium]
MTLAAMGEDRKETPIDWRTAAVARLAAPLPAAYPGGPSFEVGSHLFLSCSGAATPLGVVSFVAPSPVALAMNIAHSAAQQAEEIKRSLEYADAPSPTGLVRHITSTSELFDYFEQSMVAVFFSYQAIEAFCNEEILRKSPEAIEVKRRKKKEILERRVAERQLSTSEKLGNVLPQILAVSTMKGKALWQKFLVLEVARDEVVHLKNQTVRNNDPSKEAEQTLLRLLAEDVCYWPRVTMAILEYFVHDPIPDWYEQLKKRVI